MPRCQHLQQSHRVVATGASGETGLIGQPGRGGTALPTTQESSQGSSPAITYVHTQIYMLVPLSAGKLFLFVPAQRATMRWETLSISTAPTTNPLQEMCRDPAPARRHSVHHPLALTRKDFGMKSQIVRLHHRQPCKNKISNN